MKTDDIKEIQHYLRSLSFRDPRIRPVTVDGKYGNDTSLAVADFQNVAGLPSNGITDPVTWDRLVNAYRAQQDNIQPLLVLNNTVSSINQSSPKDTVSILQSMLFHLAGRYTNLIAPTINGIYDEETRRSVLKFKQLQGLSPDDTVDSDTWNRLAVLYNSRTVQTAAP